MRPEGPGPVEVLVEGWLDRDWMSRRRLAMRSAIDCPPLELGFDTLGEGSERKVVPERFEPTEGLDRSTDGLGLERKVVFDRLGLTEGLGRLGLTDGADRSTGELGRLNDGLGRLELTDGPCETDGARLADMRSRKPPPE